MQDLLERTIHSRFDDFTAQVLAYKRENKLSYISLGEECELDKNTMRRLLNERGAHSSIMTALKVSVSLGIPL